MSALPLSRPLVVATIPAEGMSIEVEADPAERAALAAENEVESIERLVARLEVRHAGGETIAVRGPLEAHATRICVVTLEPFVEAITEEIDVRFAPEGKAGRSTEDADAPDEIVGGAVDLGAVVAEFFTLGLDPHPRKPGARFDEAANRGDDASSPFAALGALKPRGREPD